MQEHLTAKESCNKQTRKSSEDAVILWGEQVWAQLTLPQPKVGPMNLRNTNENT